MVSASQPVDDPYGVSFSAVLRTDPTDNDVTGPAPDDAEAKAPRLGLHHHQADAGGGLAPALHCAAPTRSL